MDAVHLRGMLLIADRWTRFLVSKAGAYFDDRQNNLRNVAGCSVTFGPAIFYAKSEFG